MKKLLFVMSALSFLSAAPALAAPAEQCAAQCSAGKCSVDECSPVTWGGKGIELTVDKEAKKASVRFDCAAGSVLNWTAEENMSVGVGTYTREGGAIPPGGFHSIPASYVAKLLESPAAVGNRMTLTLILQDGIQTFELTKGQRGDVHYCP